MNTYRVIGTVTIYCETDVEAESETEALAMVDERDQAFTVITYPEADNTIEWVVTEIGKLYREVG